MFEIRDLSYRYDRKGPEVLQNVNAVLPSGAIGVLFGKNGAGKSTLLKIAAGVLKPQSGEMLFDGKDLFGMSRAKRARIAAYLPQDVYFGDELLDALLGGLAWHIHQQPCADLDDHALHTLQACLAESAVFKEILHGGTCF